MGILEVQEANSGYQKVQEASCGYLEVQAARVPGGAGVR